jgi:hypothetical protein
MRLLCNAFLVLTIVFFLYDTAIHAQTDVYGDSIYPSSDLLIKKVAPAKKDNNILYSLTASSLMDVTWMAGDTTVTYTLYFNTVPMRYLAYALKKSDRIVIDLFESTTAKDSSYIKILPPVTDVSLGTIHMEPNINLTRLVLFTQKAVLFEVMETENELQLVIQWNTKLEKEKAIKAKKRKRLIYYSLGATALVGSVIAYFSTKTPNEPEIPEEEEIPWPNIPPPDE